ncbi:MAG: polyphosphate kinase 1 [Gammaproteobacteria bacterium]|nr:polyphosphate kinase 1 [Gammaproteobacteria bacterium]MBI5616829.1 polyphosphate kinase 1 [Gammaproteobacteria bacterium]
MDAKTIDVNDPSLYINRELSLLEFNRRVLEQAKDPSNPLLERLRFLCIASSNLDEFFEIRVSGLKEQAAFQAGQLGPDQFSPAETLKRISETTHGIVAEQYRVLNEELTPLLAQEGIRFLKRAEWNGRQASWVKRHFYRELLPVLSPIGLDPSHPFPRILNKSLNFLVSLEGTDAFGRNSAIAILQAPRALPRVINIPESFANGPHEFVFLSSIIHAHVDDIFPGMRVTGCYQFRVTRNSDLFVDDEEVKDLLHALEGELHQRRFGDAVRLEVADECPQEMVSLLQHEFSIEDQDIYACKGPVNLARLMAVPDMIDRQDLKFPPLSPSRPRRITTSPDLFAAIRRGDLLLHHPYESFVPVVEFLRQAASDPDVLVIKQTLYRTGLDSPIAKTLIDAARAGKEVTVVVELKARFDEEANIELATQLQEAGAHVVYGVVGHKTHAKMVLVVRREGKQLRRYVHLATGNYHLRTARMYTDFGLFTCDNTIGVDVQKIFHQLTAPGRAGKLKKLLQSPFTLHPTMLELIRREAKHAIAGKPARIIAKMNALVEPKIIRALYEASQAGVKIDLVVRGICALRPGIEGVSDNIRVRSIIGRFLEHSRIFYFENEGTPQVYLSSADWMGRNFFNRVETCFPIEDKRLRDRVVKEGLELYLADNTRAWLLGSDGLYQRAKPAANAKPRDAQFQLVEQLCD